jgi:hypothetical protein
MRQGERVILKLLPWDVYAVVAIAVVGIILATVFGQLSILIFALITLALGTYLVIRIRLYDLS